MKNFNLEVQKLLWFTDPGHSWLRVPLKMFHEYNAKASSYSYVKNTFIYLEEDCDAGWFLKNFCNFLNVDKAKLCIIQEVYTNNNSPIRKYKHWSGIGWSMGEYMEHSKN
jgi:hypothetical protein